MRKWCDGMRFGEMVVADRPTQQDVPFYRPRFRYRPIVKRKDLIDFSIRSHFIYLLITFSRSY
jgi:hypothetical protein